MSANIDADPDMIPHLVELERCLGQVRDLILPSLKSLTEESLVAKCSSEAHAAYALAAAFTLLTSLHAQRKLENRSVDAQLAHKLNRIQEYIRKMREIGELEQIKLEHVAVAQTDAEPDHDEDDKNAYAERRKRPRIDKAAAARIVAHNTSKPPKRK